MWNLVGPTKAQACRRVLVDYLGEPYAFMFLVYRCVVGYSVLNVTQGDFRAGLALNAVQRSENGRSVFGRSDRRSDLNEV